MPYRRREIARVPFERGLDAPVVEHARPQPEREVANKPNHGVDEVPPLGDGPRHRRIAGVAKPVDGPELHAERGQHLADVVVQLAREFRAFLLLRGDKLLRELAHLPFGGLGLGALLVGPVARAAAGDTRRLPPPRHRAAV